MSKIDKIYVEDIGWIESSDGEITMFQVNGEMALVNWYRQGNREFNGKYVIEIDYQPVAKSGAKE